MQRSFHHILTSVSILLGFFFLSVLTPAAALAGPAISVTKTDDRETAVPGDTLTYSITVTNTDKKAKLVLVKDVIPSFTTFLSASDEGKLKGKPNKQHVVWKELRIPSQGSRTITMTVQVKADVQDGTVITNTVKVQDHHIATDSTKVEIPQLTGNLFIVKDTSPTPPHQLLGGTLSDPVLRLGLRADGEDIDVTRLVFMDTSGVLPVSLDRLELFRPGEETPFALATVGGCGGNPANAYCADMYGQELVVQDGEMMDVLVHARMETDVVGAVSAEIIQLELIGDSAALARGVSSANTLAVNDGDTTAEGEVFIGTALPNPNAPIIGNPNDTVLSKIVTIENVNPDPNGTAVPVGTNRTIAEYRFTAASNVNTNNGSNRATLEDLVFNVTSANVLFGGGGFDLFNTNDQTQQIHCTESAVDGSFFVTCHRSDNLNVLLEMGSTESVTLVLQADIINNQVSSVLSSALQVSLTNFSDRSKTVFGATDTESHVRWSDSDFGGSASFSWIENESSVISSAAYSL